VIIIHESQLPSYFFRCHIKKTNERSKQAAVCDPDRFTAKWHPVQSGHSSIWPIAAILEQKQTNKQTNKQTPTLIKKALKL
jgi:hypothetical protein